jgi:CRP/FNR family transcriptional regulator, cyclic AMP receptor protein
MDQKATMLSSVPLFAGLGTKQLGEIERLADEVSVKAGKVLAKEGAPAHEFFVILDGSVEIARGGKPLRTLGAGEYFGEIALIGKVPRTASATALTPVSLLVVGHREFTTLLANHQAIRDKVLTNVATWVATASPAQAE